MPAHKVPPELQRTDVVHVRFTRDDYNLLATEAEAQGIPVATLLHNLIEHFLVPMRLGLTNTKRKRDHE